MPFDNLAKNHFTEDQKQQLLDAFHTITTILHQNNYNLTPKERSKFGKVGNQMKLFINKIRDLRNNVPELSTQDVDWEEFEADYQTRKFAEQALFIVNNIATMLLNIKVLHDRDNLQAALNDYRYSTYKKENSQQAGHVEKVDELKVFFPKTGKKKIKEQ